MRCYQIKIYPYTAQVHTQKYQYYVTNQHAQQLIASFLWNHGFSPMQIKCSGLGGESPISSYRTPEGNTFNQRVMIQVN